MRFTNTSAGCVLLQMGKWPWSVSTNGKQVVFSLLMLRFSTFLDWRQDRWMHLQM